MVLCAPTSPGSYLRQEPIMEATKQQISKNKNLDLSCCFWLLEGDWLYIIGRYKKALQIPIEDDDLFYIYMEQSMRAKVCCANLLNNDTVMLKLLGRLPFLEKLEIGEQSHTGPVMTFPHESFPSLVELALHDLDLEEWEIKPGSMPYLEKLTLCKCPNLSYLPEGLSLPRQLFMVNLIVMPPGCQQGMVAQGLEERGCTVFISSNEEGYFKHQRQTRYFHPQINAGGTDRVGAGENGEERRGREPGALGRIRAFASSVPATMTVFDEMREWSAVRVQLKSWTGSGSHQPLLQVEPAGNVPLAVAGVGYEFLQASSDISLLTRDVL